MDGRKWLRRIGVGVATLMAVVLTLWATAALYFDLPSAPLRQPAAAIYLVGISAGALLFRRFALLITLAGLVFILIWWLSLKPSSTRNWQADVAQTPWAEIAGDRVTIHNVRNCDYRAEG